MYWASEVLERFERTLKFPPDAAGDAEWKQQWGGGFAWWPAGLHQEVGLRLFGPPWDTRLFVITYLGACAHCEHAPALFTQSMRDAVLSGVTTLGPAAGQVAYVSAFQQPADEAGVKGVSELVMSAAAAQLVLCIDRFARENTAFIDPAGRSAPQEVVEGLLDIAIHPAPSPAGWDDIRWLGPILQTRGLRVTATQNQVVGRGSTRLGYPDVEVDYTLTVKSDELRPRFKRCVKIELDFPSLVATYLAPHALAAALTGLALADQRAPDIIGAWSSGERVRYSAVIPAGLVASPEALWGRVTEVLDQAEWLSDRVLDPAHGFEGTLNWFKPYGWFEPAELPDWASPDTEVTAESTSASGDVVLREEAAWSAEGVPDDAVKVATVMKFRESTGFRLQYQYLIEHTKTPDPEWVLWVRVVDSDDADVQPIDHVKDCWACARCESSGLDAATGAESLLRYIWERHGAMGAGLRDASEYEVEGSELLPQETAERLLDEWKRQRPAA